MKRNLWRGTGMLLLCLVLILCGTHMAAAAEEEKTETRLTVQLNGEPMEFTDAFPLNRYDRNFLPFRAVFEALGAEVDYYHPTRSAIGVRGEVRVEIPIGDDKIYITRNGEVEVLQMDVETFTKNGRTYVPVRFVAQALGCIVEWDQKNLTVVIIDLEQMTDQAMEGEDYTLLADTCTFMDRFETGNRAVEGGMVYEAAVGGVPMITAETSFHGLTAEGGRAQLFLSMQADYSALYWEQAAAQGVLPEDLGYTEEDLYPSMELEMRSDGEAGTNYVRVSGGKGLNAEIPQNVWLTGDAVTQIMGAEVNLPAETDGALDVRALIRSEVEALKLTDSTTAYSLARDAVYAAAARLSDRAVSTEKGVRTLAWTAGAVAHELEVVYDESQSVEALLWKQTSETEEASSMTQTVAKSDGSVLIKMRVEAGGQVLTADQYATYLPTEDAPLTTLTQ